jgi:hypothetical protein
MKLLNIKFYKDISRNSINLNLLISTIKLDLLEKHLKKRLINSKNKLKNRLLYKIVLLLINLFSITLSKLTNN